MRPASAIARDTCGVAHLVEPRNVELEHGGARESHGGGTEDGLHLDEEIGRHVLVHDIRALVDVHRRVDFRREIAGLCVWNGSSGAHHRAAHSDASSIREARRVPDRDDDAWAGSSAPSGVGSRRCLGEVAEDTLERIREHVSRP